MGPQECRRERQKVGKSLDEQNWSGLGQMSRGTLCVDDAGAPVCHGGDTADSANQASPSKWRELDPQAADLSRCSLEIGPAARQITCESSSQTAYRSSSRPREMDPQAQDLCDIGTVTPLSVLLPAHMRRRRPDRGKKVRQEETHVAAIELLDFVRLSSKEVCSTVAQSRDTFIIHKIHCHARLQLCTAHFPSH
jgi:hypothetical protein